MKTPTLAAIWLLTITISQMAAASSAPADSQKLSIEEAVALMLRRNVTVRNAYLDRISGKFALEVAEDDYQPRFEVSSGTTTQSIVEDRSRDDSQDVSVNASVSLRLPTGGNIELTFDNSGSLIDGSEDFYRTQLRLNLNQPLLRGGGLTVGRSDLILARRAEESNYLGLRSQLIDAVGSIIKSYRAYQLTQRNLEISRLSLERSREQLRINQELVKAGRLPEVELIQSETDVANQELSLRSAENEEELARLNLLQTLRLPEDTRLELVTPIETSAPGKLDVDSLYNLAVNNRPDYLQSLIALSNSELSHEISRNEQLWELSLNGSYTLAGDADSFRSAFDDIPGGSRGDAVISLDLSIPIGDKSRRQSVVDSRIALIQARNNLHDLRIAIRTELLNAVRNIEILWDQVNLAKKSLDLTRTQLKLEQEKFTSGRTTSFQLVQFQNDLVDAENQYASIRISYLNAFTDLHQQLGETLDVWQVDMQRIDQATSVSDINAYDVDSTEMP